MFVRFSIGFDDKSKHTKNREVVLNGKRMRVWYDDVPEGKLKEANRLGFGVFGWVNSFNGERKKENLKEVVWWYCDIDGLSTPELKREFADGARRKMPIPATVVNETRNGFHMYWKTRGVVEPCPDKYEKIIRGINQRLRIQSVCDCNRVLRVPNMLHLKNPSDPFMVRTLIKDFDNSYTYEEMKTAFPYTNHRPVMVGKDVKEFKGDDFFKELEERNQADILLKLSGTPHVNGEIYELRGSSRGRSNIIVDGKESGAFVDENGMLGSHGQPVYTAAQWLKNTGNFNSWSDVIKIIREATK